MLRTPEDVVNEVISYLALVKQQSKAMDDDNTLAVMDDVGIIGCTAINLINNGVTYEQLDELIELVQS